MAFFNFRLVEMELLGMELLGMELLGMELLGTELLWDGAIVGRSYCGTELALGVSR